MAIPAGLKIRFHYLTTALLAVFVISLMSFFLLSANKRFGDMAQSSARGIFTRIADANALRLQEMVTDVGRVVRAQASLNDTRLFDGQSAVPLLIATLREMPNLYSFYAGADDGAFVQVIGVRRNARVAAALGAPADTFFAVRTIPANNGGPAGERMATWRFLAEDGRELGRLRQATDYSPRDRPWFETARAHDGLRVTAPYLFQSSGELGLTLSHARAGGGVIGADLALGQLSRFLAEPLANHVGGTAVFDNTGRVLAFHASQGLDTPAPQPLQALHESANPYLIALRGLTAGADDSEILSVDGARFVYAERAVEIAPDVIFHAAAFAPMTAFSGPIDRARDETFAISALVLAISLPLAFFVARRSSKTLGLLAADSERIKQLDFSGQIEVHSTFYELDTLSQAHQTMKTSLRERTQALKETLEKLEGLVDNGLLLSSERNRDTLLQHVLEGGRRLCHADAAQLYLSGENGTLRLAMETTTERQETPAPSNEIAAAQDEPPAEEPLPESLRQIAAWAAAKPETVMIDDIRTDTRFSLADIDNGSAYRTTSMLTVPLVTNSGEVMGALQFLNALDPDSGAVGPFPATIVPYIKALASQSAVALDNHKLLDAQKATMDSLVRIIAGAIDAKSAYTGGHCERVPELAVMLAEEACDVNEGALADFSFKTDDEWREFRIGAWLHDCGKVTTPEYVVDKATKLETIYNRIHEIRTRFEVLLRDAEIERLQNVLGGMAPDAAHTAFETRRAQLIEDFAFIADSNIGAESITPERAERIRRIGAQTWLRHFDDRIGLSHEELHRARNEPAAALPVVETLLADKLRHRVPRTIEQRFDERFGFKMDIPELLYDFGEEHNLLVSRGTLTEEERFKINEHIIQTIIMLDRLPLPAHLKRVPEYAGTHHETLIGSGYPRRLGADELSIPARIMAIADIFEALTASDRPYKGAKPLSEAIRLLSGFKQRKHIDADLFDLFLSSGVYLRYAERFLAPEQIDEVDMAAYLG